MLNLKLTKAPHFMQVENNEDSERRRLEQLELLSVVDDGRSHTVKITTNILDIKYDRIDQRLLSAINGVKPTPILLACIIAERARALTIFQATILLHFNLAN